jgi:dihydrofolate reductase (trimethoprim resistance protein)
MLEWHFLSCGVKKAYEGTMKLSQIVAVSNNGIIGDGRNLPWHIPKELERFKSITMGKTVIMGRRTFESLPKKLEGRHLIVLSRTMNRRDDCQVAKNITEAFQMCKNEEEVIIAGGGEVYRLCMPYTTCIYYTHVHLDATGDITYPISYLEEFDLVHSEFIDSTISYTYQTYYRKNQPKHIRLL